MRQHDGSNTGALPPRSRLLSRGPWRPAQTADGAQNTSLLTRVTSGLSALRSQIGRARPMAGRPGRRFRQSAGRSLHGPVTLDRGAMLPVVLHFARLAPESRQRRFNTRMRLTNLFHRYGTLDWDRTTLLGYRAGRQVVALAELSHAAPDSSARVTEFAVSVQDGWQRRGLAEALLRQAIGIVCGDERRPLILYTQVGNRAMIRLAQKLGGEIDWSEQDVIITFRPSPDLPAASAA